METNSSPVLAHVGRRLRPVLACLLSCAVALAVAEGAVALYRQDAFPFLRLFRPDPAFGVRLLSKTCARIRTQSGRVVESCTNADGFRGRLRSPDAERTIAIIGDSQVFGYAVADNETTAAQLQARLSPSAAVLNRGVPTWGPKDYLAALDEVALTGPLDDVVIVLNASNDFFEVNAKNTRRTTARHGFATSVRSTKAMAKESESPLPNALPSLWHRSHLVYLAKRAMKAAASPPQPRARAAELLLRDAKRLAERALARGEKSVFTPFLREAVARCQTHGCRLTIVVLPIDVQVDSQAWKKYGSQRRRDMAPTLSLLDAAADAARAEGANAIAFHRLRPTGEFGGLFLDDNDHLSPEGHALLADTIAAQLRPNPEGKL